MICPDCGRFLSGDACPRCGWAPPREPKTLSEEQAGALARLDAGESILLTGVAGTGKSFTTAEWIRRTQRTTGSGRWEAYKHVAVTAASGIAATLLPGGRTLHSWVGMGLADRPAEKIATSGWLWRVAPRIERARALVISEISMLGAKAFCLASDLCKIARRDDRPFGGLQLLLDGDMGQLPPVDSEDDFAFETEEWWDANGGKGISTVELRKVHRQQDEAFARVLREIRDGVLSDEGRGMIESRVRVFDPEAAPAAVRLSTHNDLVESTNRRRLDALEGEERTFRAVEEGDPRVIERLERNCTAPRDLVLKVGARVMIVRNDPGGAFVNGTLGVVTWLSADGVEVETDRGLVLVFPRAVWGEGFEDQEELDEAVAERRPLREGQGWRAQFPLRLAWAITIHKCVDLETLVETDRGLQPIGEAKGEGSVVVPDGVARVAAMVVRGPDDAVKITTKRGFEITASIDHGFKTSNGRVDAKDLREGSELILVRGWEPIVRTPAPLPASPTAKDVDVRARWFRVPDALDVPTAEFLGLMVGDGTVFRAGFRLAKRHSDVVAHFASLCERLFGAPVKLYRKNNADHAEVSSTFLSTWLRRIHGLAPNEKDVPREILSSPAEIRAAFLRGLFEDGSVHLKEGKWFSHVEWSTAYEPMARVVQTMLLQLGVISSRIKIVREIRGTERDSWRLLIYGKSAVRLREVVRPFFAKVKQEKLGLAKGTGGSVRGGEEVDTGDHDAPWFRDPVVSMEPVRVATACFEVPGVGRFLQNGFDGFNSQGASLDRVSVDLGAVFAPGQAYVALSRVRSLKGLNVERWSGAASIVAHPRALAFMRGEYRPPEGYLASRGG